jgi:hypothetical protein
LSQGRLIPTDIQLGGTTDKKVFQISDIQAIYKTGNDLSMEWSNVNAEVAAYVMDQFLGTHLVPMTVKRAVGSHLGSMQYFVRNLCRFSQSGNGHFQVSGNTSERMRRCYPF